jgi:hypothetical protein
MAFGIGLLKEFTALGRGRDWVENSGVGNARLSVIGDELISVGSNADSRITRSNRHSTLSVILFLVEISRLAPASDFESDLGLKTMPNSRLCQRPPVCSMSVWPGYLCAYQV